MRRIRKGLEVYWSIQQQDPYLITLLSQKLSISPIFAKLLMNRGITDPEEAELFLSVNYKDLHDPFLLPEMHRAVARLTEAFQKKEKVLIVGDYDVDGVASTALLWEFLTSNSDFEWTGCRASYFIPDRVEMGYDLNLEAIRHALELKANLIITADCGSTAYEPLYEAQKAGIDVIITDHHKPSQQPLPVVAFLNPLQQNYNHPEYPFPYLAGVGVVFKLVQAFCRIHTNNEKRWAGRFLDLVALGTVADVVPLQNENRLMTKLGLMLLSSGRRCGIKALKGYTRLKDKDLKGEDIAFYLAPRLNAAGRLGSAHRAVDLLISTDQDQARPLAAFLNQENTRRRTLDTKISEQIEEIIKRDGLEEAPALVLSSPGWHPGVIGVAASKLAEKYSKPVMLFTEVNGVGRASCRSIPGFDLHKLLIQYQDYFLDFGGHSGAVGFTMNMGFYSEFREKILKHIQEISASLPTFETINIDCLVSLDEIDEAVVEELTLLEPTGHGNPKPIFQANNVLILDEPLIINGKHLRFAVQQDQTRFDTIGFHLASRFAKTSPQQNRYYDILFCPHISSWKGIQSIELEIFDIRAAKS